MTSKIIDFTEVDGVFVEGSKGSSKSGGGNSPGVSSSGGIEAPNTLQNNTFAVCVDLIGEGPILGLYDSVITALGGGNGSGAKSVYFNNVPFVSPIGDQNFFGAIFGFRNGVPGQDVMPGVVTASNEVSVNTNVTQTVGPIVRTVTDSTVTAVRVTIEIPALYHLVTGTGDVTGTDLEITVEIQTGGGAYANVITDSIVNQKCTSPYERSYTIALGDGSVGSGPWNIRVTRITPDSTDSNLVNAFAWAGYTEITSGNFPYPNCAVIATSFNAQLFGTQVPTRSFDVLGLIVDIPSNYDPVAHVYTGVWDGTFIQGWTNNPVWVLLDLLLNPRYGLGQRVSLDNIDIGSFYLAAQYCDVQIPDGKGGLEFRYTFNGQITQQNDAYKVLQSVASSFRGILFWTNGTVYLKADMPTLPVALVAPANVIDGKFTYSGSALKSRHTAALVTFKDPLNNYDDTVEFVVDNPGIQELGYRQINIVAFGCTSRGQAHRFGAWILDTERTQTETVVYQASFDQCFLKPGDVVYIADPAYSGARYGGRIVNYVNSGGTDLVTIDQTLNLDGNQTYQLQFVKQDQTMIPLTTILNPGGTWNVMTIAAQGLSPLKNAMWMITSSNLQPRQFQVQSLREVSRGIIEITALFYDPNKFARVEEGVTVTTPVYTNFPVTPPVPPSNLSVIESDYIANGVAVSRLTFGWSPSTDVLAFKYGVYYEDPSHQVVNLPLTSQFAISVDPAQLGPYTFNVFCLTTDGRQSIVSAITVTCTGKSTAPAPPSGITLFGGSHQITIKWVIPPNLDYAYTEVWASQTNDIATVTLIGLAAAGSFIFTGLANSATWYFWLKSVDQSGNHSAFTSPSVHATTVYLIADDIADALLTTAAFAQSIKAPAVVNGLPNPLTWGGNTFVYNTLDGKLYNLISGAWVKIYSDNNSTTMTNLNAAFFSLGINIPAVVTSLPVTGTEGQTVTLTTDGKLYRWHSGAWTVTTDGVDIAARSIAANKLIVGTITANEIAANTITAGLIAANTITAGQIAAGAIGAAQIAAGSIRGTNIASNTITGDLIEANTIDCISLKSSTISSVDIFVGNPNGSAYIKLHALDDGNGWGPYMEVVDANSIVRVAIGRIAGDYGIFIADHFGSPVLLETGVLGNDIVGFGQIINGNVNTNHLAISTVTNVASDVSASGVTTSSWVSFSSVTLSFSGQNALVMFSAISDYNNNGSAIYLLNGRIVLDGSTVVWSGVVTSGSPIVGSVSVPGISGSHTFDFELQNGSTGIAIVVHTVSMIVMDAKR
jgi:predicted phage tail protein